MLEHEYVVLGGLNRSLVGRYLTLVASFISGALVFLFLTFVDVAKEYNLPINLPPTIMSLFSASLVFSVLYLIFNKTIWKLALAAKILKIADLSGAWNCKGETLDINGKTKTKWEGKLTIVQTWDRIRVNLRTTQSSSDSITAALVYDEALGFRLLYNYENTPRPGEPNLKSHTGSANFTFSKDLKSAEGDYFNGYGRPTYGRMELRKDGQ